MTKILDGARCRVACSLRATFGQKGEIMATKKKSEMKLVIVAGDCGVYVGLLEGGAASVKESTVHLINARHLRRYYVMGKTGDGSVTDLAARGLDPSSTSVTQPLIGMSTMLGVRRVFDVAASAVESFGVPK